MQSGQLILIFSTFITFVGVARADGDFVAIVPLTGNAADQGEWARRGFELALEELNQEKPSGLTLHYEDSKGGDAAVAVQAYKSLAMRGKPSVVFTYGSGVGMALSPMVNADKVIQMGIATATPKYSSPGDYTFRNFPSAAIEAEFLSKTLLEKRKVTSVAILNINNDYGVGSAGAFKGAFTAHGGEIIAEESYNPGETDFKAQLLKLKRQNVAQVYLAVYPADGALILKQAKELGLSTQFVASVAIIGGKDFFNLAGDAAEGLLVVSSAVDEHSTFAKHYEKKYQNESTAQQIYVARAYDALKIIAQVAATCKSVETTCLRDELFKIHGYHGASGTISFDQNGDTSTDFSLFRVQNKAFVRVD